MIDIDGIFKYEPWLEKLWILDEASYLLAGVIPCQYRLNCLYLAKDIKQDPALAAFLERHSDKAERVSQIERSLKNSSLNPKGYRSNGIVPVYDPELKNCSSYPQWEIGGYSGTHCSDITPLFAPIDVIAWALEKPEKIPEPLINWYKKQPQADDKPTKQKITAEALAKIFNSPTPKLVDVTAHFFNITNKAEANRKYKDGSFFRVFKLEGSTQKSPYLVDLESLAAHLNKDK